MPKIRTKVIRVRDPVTGIWHDLPAVVSKESILAAERALASEQAAAQSEENAQAWAEGKRGDSDVGGGDPAYHNNAKYWKNEAKAEKEDAEAWSKGTKNGEEVSSDADQYHDNAKYWKDQARGEKEDAEAYAVGTRGGEDVGNTDPTYHNNAKYYTEQAGSSAEAAAQSAEDAQDVLDSIPEDYSQLSADVGDLKTQINTKADKTALNEEIARAENKELELEQLFTAPTQEAIDSWLNDHPGATSTVDFNIVNKVYPTVSDFISDLSLSEGDYIKTNGFHLEGDGGGAYYKIYTTGTANNKDVFAINTNPTLYAVLIENGNFYNPMAYGAYGDGVHDDSDFVQYALNKAIANKGAVEITKNHKIANIAIDKSTSDNTEIREPTYIIGKGGKLISDTGVMFKYGGYSGSNSNDIYFINIHFIGDSLSTLMDCTNLFRIYFKNCEFNDFEKCFYTSGYIQSYIIDSCIFINIEQSCFEYDRSFDLKIINCIAEQMPNSRFVYAPTRLSCNLTIKDCCIEGFTNIIPIYLSSCTATTICNNYFEANKQGDIEFNPLASDINAVSIFGNQNAGVTDTSKAMIKWAGQHIRNCQSYGNYCAGIPINDLTLVPNDNFISTFNNRSDQASAKTNINGKYIKDPFRGNDVIEAGAQSFEKINNYYRRFLTKIASYNTETEIFNLTSPYASDGFFYAILHLSGSLYNIGRYSAEYRISQDGTVTPVFQSRDISQYINFEYNSAAGQTNSLKIKTNQSGASSVLAYVEIFGAIRQVTFENTRFAY